MLQNLSLSLRELGLKTICPLEKKLAQLTDLESLGLDLFGNSIDGYSVG